MAVIIRTSDRLSFKGCRRAWDYGSKIRQDLEPAGAVPKPLEFGTAIHAALEVWYHPDTWGRDREVIELAALQRFLDVQEDQKRRYLEAQGQETLEEAMAEDYKERLTLGSGMLGHYFDYSKRKDTRFKPVAVELEFEVPIFYEGDTPGPLTVHEGRLRTFDGEFVVYQGRIDMLVQDADGLYWIWDHKTTARMEEDTSFLELDEQCGSYGWALQHMLKIPIAGIVYNQLYKGFPQPPKKNANQRKGLWYSVNKMQDTSYDLYLATVQEGDPLGYAGGGYDDILNYLKNEGKQFFRRIQVHRNQKEYESLGRQIADEAIDMLDDPRIYPNPGKWRCGWCAFRGPCLAQNEQSDVQYLIKNFYRKRERV